MALLACWMSYSCSQTAPNKKTQDTAAKALPDYFRQITLPDTLRFEIAPEGAAVEGDTIPNNLFFGQLETHLMNGIGYFGSGGLTAIGKQRFLLTENIEAYQVEMHQGWYQNHSLFLFDKSQNFFSARETVAEFYGGDGGQILAGSWLVDYDKDGDKDLIRREIEHWLILNDEHTKDTIAEHAVLLRWQDGKFVLTPADTSELVSAYPIQSRW